MQTVVCRLILGLVVVPAAVLQAAGGEKPTDRAAQRSQDNSRARYGQFARANFGVVRTDKRRYAPLDEARIRFECRREPSSTFVFRVDDGAGRPYFRKAARASSGTAEVSVTVGGAPGLHI